MALYHGTILCVSVANYRVKSLSGAQKKLKKLQSLLPKTLRIDRYKIKREINKLKRYNTDSPPSEEVKKRLRNLENRLQSSIKKRSWRKENLPKPTYNDSLPITAKKNEIITSILKHQVVIISGETGSGKTTQIPKFCLASGRGIDGRIGCTQPRRIAAVAVTNRIAEELGEKAGESVGYKIRFKDRTRHDSFIKIMTDGILLAETHNDPYLNEYDTIIVDEAHERSLNIDFILGILKTLLKKRKDLKLIITSATIDTEKFSKAFNNAPVIEVSGRMYPVEVQYHSTEQEKDKNEDQTHIELTINAVDNLQKQSPFGDILVFMPTEQDIRETCEILEGKNYKGAIVLPLFARLSGFEQSRIFSRSQGRKIIVSTNVAETSLTIPGIKYVIDAGLARIPRYTPRTRTTSLPVSPISRSSADQRKGRCGRVENGVCIRLFSEEDYNSRSIYTLPEILRANLAEVILRMIDLKLGDISDFPFIDRPDPKSVRDGFELLSELGAIKTDDGRRTTEGRGQRAEGGRRKTESGGQRVEDGGQRTDGGERKAEDSFFLTEKGKIMAKMPVAPRLSRMLIEAEKEGCIKELAIIASALSLQDPRERPTDKYEAADKIHATFNDPSSDFITFINIWNKYHETLRKEKSTNKLKRFCKANYLSFKRMREWRDIHAQVTDILKECGMRNVDSKTVGVLNTGSELENQAYEKIHKSILSGFLSNIAMKKEKNIFTAAKGKEVMIFPGSGLFNKAGKWIVAAEMVRTSRLFARTAAKIDSNWLEDLGKAQCKYTYMHPHWERIRGEVIALEQVSLFGLIILSDRSVSYGRINPDEATDIFIQSALVNGDVKRPFQFMKYNKKLIDEVEDMENRIRRRDILVSENDMFQFYKDKLENIYNIKSLENFIKKRGGDSFLRMKEEDLLLYSPDVKELSLFPDSIELGDRSFQCVYNFDPEKNDDGLTVKIPISQVSMIPIESLDWLVPGLFREKIEALIKSLPKVYRRKLVPVSKSVDTIVNEMSKGENSLIIELGKFIKIHFGINIPASAWSLDSLPDHLKMRISIMDPRGEELCSGREKDILNLNNVIGAEQKESGEFKSARKKWERTGIREWDFKDLPETVSIKGRDGAQWVFYPGLKIENKSISLRLFQNKDEAVKSHKKGVSALFEILFSKDLKFLKKTLTLPKDTANTAKYFGGAKQFEKMLYENVIKDLFHKNIQTKDKFYSHAGSTGPTIFKKGQIKLDGTLPVLKAFHDTRSTIYSLEKAERANSGIVQFLKRLREELSRLVPETYMELYDDERMVHIPRYVKAIAVRAKRGVENIEKDKFRSKEIKIYSDRLNGFLEELSNSVSSQKRNAIEDFFWLVEEYKVSIFAQELKTPFPVSKKRLDEKLKEIERMI